MAKLGNMPRDSLLSFGWKCLLCGPLGLWGGDELRRTLGLSRKETASFYVAHSLDQCFSPVLNFTCVLSTQTLREV